MERISAGDDTLIACYANHIQRYDFALPHCAGRLVLDAGCGTGYGSHHLAARGAARVVGVDIDAGAIAEARRLYARPNLEYREADLHRLDRCEGLPDRFDVVVNFENLEHLADPRAFLEQVRRRLPEGGGTFLTSTPNGDVSDLDEDGRPRNRYHVQEFKPEEFIALLEPHFDEVRLYGQWQTYDGRLRVMNAERLHAQLCEAYFNPMARLGRAARRLLGRRAAGPPAFTAPGESFSGDYTIANLEERPVPWPPSVLLAVCTGRVG